ncbi:hypothetical protein LTR16_012120, partial [Cryomyces antarcticus]
VDDWALHPNQFAYTIELIVYVKRFGFVEIKTSLRSSGKNLGIWYNCTWINRFVRRW